MEQKYRFLLIIILLFINQASLSQKLINVTIALDSNINREHIDLKFFNGKDFIPVVDFRTGKSTIIHIIDSFYFRYAILYISSNNEGDTKSESFFVNENAAVFNIKKNDQNDNFLIVSENATNINSSDLEINRQLYTKEINNRISAFWQENASEINNNDSIQKILQILLKELNNANIEFLKQHSENYYSLWFFRDQILNTFLTFFNGDKNYYLYIKNKFEELFNSNLIDRGEIQYANNKFINDNNFQSLEGQTIPFHVKNISGEIITSESLKGRFVLIDFWATWCPPCIQALPELKKIRNRYPEEKLVIISISNDFEYSKFLAGIKNYKLNWVNIYDKYKNKNELFNISSIPAIFLINEEGKIIYDSRTRPKACLKEVNDLLKKYLKNRTSVVL